MALITAAAGPNFPTADGIYAKNDCTITVIDTVGSSTISATVQYQDSEGNWADVVDASNRQIISNANYMEQFVGGSGISYRINVTAISGDNLWAYAFHQNASDD